MREEPELRYSPLLLNLGVEYVQRGSLDGRLAIGRQVERRGRIPVEAKQIVVVSILGPHREGVGREKSRVFSRDFVQLREIANEYAFELVRGSVGAWIRAARLGENAAAVDEREFGDRRLAAAVPVSNAVGDLGCPG